MTRRRLPAVCVVLAALMGPSPWAAAQGQLPAEVVTASDPTGEQLKQLDGFVDELLPKLEAGDAEAVRARNRLLEPLRAAGRPSVRFRQEYSNRLLKSPKAKTLAQLATSNPDQVAYSAIRIAGELATPEAADIVVKALKDKRTSVRIVAAAAIGRTFDAIRDSSPAMGAADALRLTAPLGQVITGDAEPEVVRVSIKSLASGMGVTRQGYESLRPAAYGELSGAVGTRAKALQGSMAPFMPSLLAAAQVTREALQSLNDPRLRLDENGNKAAGNLSGHLLTLVMNRLGDLKPPVEGDQEFKAKRELRAQALDLVAGAEVCASQAMGALGRPLDPKGLAEEFKKGTPEGDRAFFQKCVEVISALKQAGLGPFMDAGGGR